MKKLINFFKKNKLGSTAIEAMIVVPLWLATIIFVGRTLIISNSRYTLAHESLPVGNIVSLSKSKDEAITEISSYFKLNKVKNIDITDIEMKYITSAGTLLDDWKDVGKPGDAIRIKMKINTPFDDMRFTSMNIGGQTVDFFPAEFTNEFTVALSYKR